MTESQGPNAPGSSAFGPTAGSQPGPESTAGPTRIGNADRQQAMDALDVHMSAGRLDPDEYGERIAKASVARTTADLEPLFSDLPEPHAIGAPTPLADDSATVRSAGSTGAIGWMPTPGRIPLPAPGSRGRQKHHGREPLGGRVGEVAVGLTPFIAVGLFFATTSFLSEAWLFFLLIPVVGVIVYGRDDHDRHDRDHR